MNTKIKPEADIAETLGLDRDAGLSRYKKIWIFACLLVFIAIGCAIYWNIKSKTDSIRYKTMEAIRGDLTVTVTATGALEPTNQVDVGV